MNPLNLSTIFCITCVMLASLPLSAQQPAPKPTIVVGSDVSLSSVKKAEWIQGEAPKSFEPGNVYIFECWSTWCGPCIGMIPHVNELHKKYYDKGLRIYGMSVWENDKNKTKTFVQRKGDKMSYPVAFTGKGSAFEKEWMVAAGAKSIPHAFIVRNGKLVASTQASRLTDALIETLLSGDEGAKKAADTILAAQTHQGKTDKLVQDIKSVRGQDAKKMTALINKLKALDPDHPEILTLELRALIAGKDWPAAVTALNEMPASESKKSFVAMTSFRLARGIHHNYPDEFMEALVNAYTEYVLHNEFPIGPNHYVSLSMLQWRIGDKQEAVITADKGIESAEAFSKVHKSSHTSPYVRFAKSVNAGTMPNFSDIGKWQREAKKETADAEQPPPKTKK